jgi:hypothetical protein
MHPTVVAVEHTLAAEVVVVVVVAILVAALVKAEVAVVVIGLQPTLII